MTATNRHADTSPRRPPPRTPPPTTFARRALALLRIGFGLTFLWAFFDKLFALGYATGRLEDGSVDRFGDAAWINGGSPTEGFLKFGADGPFKASTTASPAMPGPTGCSCSACSASASPSPWASGCGSPPPPASSCTS